MRWLKETEHKATHLDDVWILRRLDAHLYGVKLVEINRDMLDSITVQRLADGVENGTINRMLAVIRAILRRSVLEWGWLDQVPKVRMLPVVPKERARNNLGKFNIMPVEGRQHNSIAQDDHQTKCA